MNKKRMTKCQSLQTKLDWISSHNPHENTISPIQACLRVPGFHLFAHTDYQRNYPEGPFLLVLQLKGISSCIVGMSKYVADNLVASLVIPTS